MNRHPTSPKRRQTYSQRQHVEAERARRPERRLRDRVAMVLAQYAIGQGPMVAR